MRPLSTAASDEFKTVRFILTDMDETLTYQGRLAAATYRALERLQDKGIKVIPVTAAPAGWCDQMARMWPVDGVIGENGGLFFQRAPGGHGVTRRFWHSEDGRLTVAARLDSIARTLREEIPQAALADDQPFRLTSIAFTQPENSAITQRLIARLRELGADATLNNLWVLGWVGGYDKLSMARRVLAETYGLNIDTHPEAVLYTGDSTNDAPMFGFFKHCVGVSTVRRYLHEIPVPPRWVTNGPGGAGFVEAAEAVLSAI
ncbi:HAD-IIB family hydrolase [Achromobacter sp.]|uniref:HAD-IIB family hydrolase n=1 Tax=Achromobacter sp. TaxID=134375 RepID=UPI000EE367B5|nr:HAD-IIB family hydrolase [Achromobacter sp.]HCW21116.1 HAD family hydrolase [Achromobacter sp.]